MALFTQSAQDHEPCFSPGDEHPSHDASCLETTLRAVTERIAPLWPLQDFVAVSPFTGLSDLSFLRANEHTRRLQHVDLLPPLSYYRERFASGALTTADISRALAECERAAPGHFAGFTVAGVVEFMLAEDDARPESAIGQFLTPAEVIDRRLSSRWSASIIQEVSKHCAAHFDRGQALWVSPWKDRPLYDAWRAAASVDRRVEMIGLPGFRAFVSGLPSEPRAAVAKLLATLEVPREAHEPLIERALMTLSGWASFVRYVSGAGQDMRAPDELVGLLAIRLAYDVALATSALAEGIRWRDVYVAMARATHPDAGAADVSGSVRYVLLVASEIAYRRKLCLALRQRPAPRTENPARSLAQFVFCIDVRSEIFRRHLETLSSEVETLGFAGFFGIPLEFVPLGESAGVAHCPVLLSPSVRVVECIGPQGSHEQTRVLESRKTKTQWRKVWKRFQASAASCFTFVEAIGPLYLMRCFARSAVGMRGHAEHLLGSCNSVYKPRPVLADQGPGALTLPQRAELAVSILRNLGLGNSFARLVVLCGHGSQSVNNPHKASLDCGACGGHAGDVNARIAADLLNDLDVRRLVAERGVQLPEDVWFIAAFHNTTTDELTFLDRERIPEKHKSCLEEVERLTTQAGLLARAERAPRLGAKAATQLPGRGRDWSEIRPEWGLAGNAAFIAAPRRRTSGLDLGGRAFLHSYEHSHDPEGKVLELIMTAPMIVAHWINAQYYASTVDNRAWGSGNKAIHNVVGTFGVYEGNGGDLKAGLPWQSVYDGHRWQHEPLRLLVVVEAPRQAIDRVLAQHEHVARLFRNQWLTLLSIEADRFYRWSGDAEWQAEDAMRTPRPSRRRIRKHRMCAP